MQRPQWVTVIGILGIVFAALGLIAALQTMITPLIVDSQKKFMADMRRFAKRAPRNARNRNPSPDPLFRKFEKWIDIPDWYRRWTVIAGGVTILICGIYLFASISMLLMKPFAIVLFYGISGISIAFNLLEAIVAVSVSPWMMAGVWMNSAIGIVADIVLIAVVASSDKLAFERAIDAHEIVEIPADECRIS